MVLAAESNEVIKKEKINECVFQQVISAAVQVISATAAFWGRHVGHCDTRLHAVLTNALGHCPEPGLQSVLHSRYLE